jgi:hypothetical protein
MVGIFFDGKGEEKFMVEVGEVSIHGVLFGDDFEFFSAEVLSEFLAVDLCGGVDDEVVFVDGGVEVEEGVAVLEGFECGEGEHGAGAVGTEGHDGSIL